MATDGPRGDVPRAMLEDRYDGLMFGRRDARRDARDVFDPSALQDKLDQVLHDLVAGVRREPLVDGDLIVEELEMQLRTLVLDAIEASR